eukprot:9415536-Heterocapsa_arctica.AAC.1
MLDWPGGARRCGTLGALHLADRSHHVVLDPRLLPAPNVQVVGVLPLDDAGRGDLIAAGLQLDVAAATALAADLHVAG